MATSDRVAIIDFGSNTARVVVYEYEAGCSFHLVDELRQVVRLSEGMGATNIIRGPAFERGLDALVTFRTYIDASGIEQVHAAATAAVRQAKNGESFLAAARQRANIELRILSGEEEARAATLAVANSLALERALVLDLGGGSVQLGQMEERRLVRGQTWPLGAVRTTEEILRGNPPKKKSLDKLAAHAREALGPWLAQISHHSPAAAAASTASSRPSPSGRPRRTASATAAASSPRSANLRHVPPPRDGSGAKSGLAEAPEGLPLVGVGGTVRNLARVEQRQVGYPVDLKHGYLLERERLEQVVEELCGMTVAQRLKVPGLAGHRADIVAGGAVVIREALRLSGAPGILICGQGVREGMLYPFLFAEEPHHLCPEVRRFSALNLMRRYHDRPRHNGHVEHLALSLYDQLAPLHGHGPAERELLSAAALVHDIGMAIDYYDHHKHGFFLVMSRPLPGYTHREQAIIALLVRYHRKGTPQERGLGRILVEGDMTLVARLAGMLRMAEYLERSKAQRVRDVRCHLGEDYIQVEVQAGPEAHVEVMEARRWADLLAEAFGVTVEVVRGS